MKSCNLPSVLCSSHKSKGTKGDASLSFSHQQSMDFSISAQGPKEAIVLKPTNHNGNIDIIYSDSTMGGKQLQMSLYKILIINNSLHTYCSLGKDGRADGELLMYYKGQSGNYLIVCIPVMFSSPTTIFSHNKGNTISKTGTQTVKKMIQMAPLKTKRGEQTVVTGLNMNALFPRGKPFFHEQQPSDDGDHCFGINSGTTMIVYDKNDIHILLDKQIEREFNSKTVPSESSSSHKSSLWVQSNNKKGSKMTRKGIEGFENNNNDTDNDDNDTDNDDNDNNDDNDDNDIYIDCRPTGSDGKALYEEDLSLFKPSLNMGNFKKLEKTFSFIEKIKNSPVFYLIIGLLIAFVIVKFGNKAISKSREFLQKRAARKLAQ